MKKSVALIVPAALLAAPVAAGDPSGTRLDAAEIRLRGCLSAGAATAPKTNLASALQSVRTFCRPQIDDLAAIRMEEAAKGLHGVDAEQAQRRAMRDLNDEIARAVANFTGLTE